MTEPYVHPVPLVADGRPRKLEAGWFVKYLVRSRDANGAAIQARIKAKIAQLQSIDVVQVTAQDQGGADPDPDLWVVELQIEAPASGVIGL